MKIDADIHFLVYDDMIDNKKTYHVPVDLDYVEDFDDVIDEIEVNLFETYGKPFHFNVDFTCTNETDICAEIMNDPAVFS